MSKRQDNSDNLRPLARIEGVSVTVSGNETLVYDRERYLIHRLNRDVATVWNLADGTRDITALSADASAAVGTKVSMGDVDAALEVLTSLNLMKGVYKPKTGLSRRLFVGGAAGAAAAATFVPAFAATGECVPDSCSQDFGVDIPFVGWVALLRLTGTTGCGSDQCCGELVGLITGTVYETDYCSGGGFAMRGLSVSGPQAYLENEAAAYEAQNSTSDQDVKPASADEDTDTWNESSESGDQGDSDSSSGDDSGAGDQGAPDTSSYDPNDTSFDKPVDVEGSDSSGN